MYSYILLAAAFIGGAIVSSQDIASYNFKRCPVRNSTCQNETISQIALQSLVESGYPQFNIGSVDPSYLRPTSQQVFDFITLSLEGGELLNICNITANQHCRIDKLVLDLENRRRRSFYNCGKLVLQGRYSLKTDPAFTFLVGDITGSGNFSVALEGWTFDFDYGFGFVKKNDTIFLKEYSRNGRYASTVDKKATFKVDLIKQNGKNITKKVLAFLNKYWKKVVDYFGGTIKQLAKVYYDDAYGNLFSHVPASYLFTDDLEPYVTADCDQ